MPAPLANIMQLPTVKYADRERHEIKTRSDVQDAVDVAATSAARLVQQAGDLSAKAFKGLGEDEATCREKSVEASQEVSCVPKFTN